MTTATINTKHLGQIEVTPRTLKILRKAREFVSKAWAQEAYWQRQKSGPFAHCAIGALGRATTGSAKCCSWDADPEAVQVLGLAIARKTKTGRVYHFSDNIEQWNDEESRKQEQVVGAFDLAIEITEKALAKA